MAVKLRAMALSEISRMLSETLPLRGAEKLRPSAMGSVLPQNKIEPKGVVASKLIEP